MYGTAKIDYPSRYVNVVVPCSESHAPPEALFLTSEHGERVPAQMVEVAHYANGLPKAIQVWGMFKNPPTQVTISEDDKEPLPPFEWTEKAIKAWRWIAAGADATRNQFQGHVVRRMRVATRNKVAWYTAFSGSDCIRVDMVIHNAAPFAAPQELYNINLGVPLSSGYEAEMVIYEPYDSKDGFLTAEQGKPFYMPQRGRRIIRFILRPAGSGGNLSDAIGHREGYGVSSAWREKWANFTSVKLPVPDFKNNGLRASLANETYRMEQAIANGTSYPSSFTQSQRLGLWHPMTGKEGGMTGGYLIGQFPGADVAYTGSALAMYGKMLEQRMMTDRCHVGIVELDGEPAKFEDYHSIPGWRMRSDDPRFDKAGATVFDGPFGFSTQAPLPAGTCWEQPEMDSWEPIDFAHWIRSAGSSITLAWLCNDPISKWLLKQDAQLALMSWAHGRIDNDWNFLNAHPHKGIHWSRIQGWMLRVIAEAYALHGDSLRSQLTGFAFSVLRGASTGFMYENGLLQVDTTGKESNKDPYKGLYGVSVAIQHGLLHGGLFCLANATGLGFKHDVLKGMQYLMQGSNTLWSAATRLKDPNASPFTAIPTLAGGLPGSSAHPSFPDGKPDAPGVDSEQTRCLLGYVGNFEGNPAIKARVVDLIHTMLGANPEAALIGMGKGCTDSDAVLLSYIQRDGIV